MEQDFSTYYLTYASGISYNGISIPINAVV